MASYSSLRRDLEIDRSAVRFVYENIDKSCSCENCLKTFENVSALFRHISHAKSCSNHYGKVYVDAMRKELRLNSKRNWFNANRDSINVEKKKSYYFPHSKRQTKEGRAFETVLRPIFYEFRSLAKKHIEEYGNDKANFISDEDVDKALDKTFDFEDWELHWDMPGSHTLEGMKELENEEDNLNLYFTALEKRFKCSLDSFDVINKSYYWGKHQQNKIGSELWTYCSNRAYLTIFNEEEFKQMLMNSQEFALDEVFFKLIVTEGYFKDDLSYTELEKKLEQAYHGLAREKLLKESEANGISFKLRLLMKEILKKRIYCDELEILNPYSE